MGIIFVFILVVLCMDIQSSLSHCHFLNALQIHLNLKNILLVYDQRNQLLQSETFGLMCPEILMMSRIRLQSKLCKIAQIHSSNSPRLFIFTKLTVPIHSLKNIFLNHCDINNILLYFLDKDDLTIFNDIDITVNCRFLITYPGHSRFIYHLWEVYRVRFDFPLQKIYYGMWKETTGFSFKRLPSIYKQRNKFQNVPLKMGVSSLPPYSNFIAKQQKFNGVVFDVWMAIAESLHIRTINKFFNVEGTGNIKVNNSWKGLIGEIVNHNIALGMSIGYSNSRKEAIHFVREILKDEYHVFIRHNQIPDSKDRAYLFRSYIEPFSISVWYSIFFLLIVLCSWDFFVFLFIETQKHSKLYELMQSFFNILGILCQQGSSYRPQSLNSISGRISLYVFFISFLILYISYSSCIISYLVSEDHPLAFDDFPGLLKYGGFIIHVSNSSSIYQKIEESKSDNDMQILFYDYLLPNKKNLPGNERGLENVLLIDRYSFITLETMAKAYFRNHEVHIEEFAFNRQPTFMSIVIDKNSTFKRFIDNKILLMYECGLLQYLKNKYISTDKPIIIENDFKMLPLEKTILQFCILFGGYILSLIFFLIEKSVFNYKYLIINKLKFAYPIKNEKNKIYEYNQIEEINIK